MAQADHIGDATEMAQPAPASKIVHGDKLPPTMMGTDPADALINTEEAQELLDSAESPPAPGSIASIVGGIITAEAEEQLAQAEQPAPAQDVPAASPGVTVELTLEMAGDIKPGGYSAAVHGLFFTGDKADIITATRIAFGRPCRVTFEPLPELPRQRQAKLGV